MRGVVRHWRWWLIDESLKTEHSQWSATGEENGPIHSGSRWSRIKLVKLIQEEIENERLQFLPPGRFGETRLQQKLPVEFIRNFRRVI